VLSTMHCHLTAKRTHWADQSCQILGVPLFQDTNCSLFTTRLIGFIDSVLASFCSSHKLTSQEGTASVFTIWKYCLNTFRNRLAVDKGFRNTHNMFFLDAWHLKMKTLCFLIRRPISSADALCLHTFQAPGHENT
jgi:hypothetical protein